LSVEEAADALVERLGWRPHLAEGEKGEERAEQEEGTGVFFHPGPPASIIGEPRWVVNPRRGYVPKERGTSRKLEKNQKKGDTYRRYMSPLRA
jgi:hypothetical protein